MLQIYPVVLELVRRVGKLIPALRMRSPELAGQCERALISIPSTWLRAHTLAAAINRRVSTRRPVRRVKCLRA
jgi:hypothetical protein